MNQFSLQIEGTVIVIPIIISIIVSMIFFAILKRSINSKNELKQINEQLRNQLETHDKTIDQKIESIRTQLDTRIDNNQNNFSNKVAEISDKATTAANEINKIKEIQDAFEIFKTNITTENANVNRMNLEDLKNSINTQLEGLDEKIKNITDREIQENIVVKDEFYNLRDRINDYLGNDDNDEKISKLFEILESDSIKTIQWKCDLLSIMKSGYVPEIHDESIKGRFSKNSAQKFIKLLKEKGIIETDEIEIFQINEDEFWIYDYIKNPSQLLDQFDNFKLKKTREREYQDFIEDNIELVETGLKVLKREYQLRTGPIDFLCSDKDGNRVGLELKFPKAQSKDVRQLDGYVNEHSQINGLDENNRIRGILVAPEISEKVFENLKSYRLFGKEVKFSNTESIPVENERIESNNEEKEITIEYAEMEFSTSVDDEIREKIQLRYFEIRDITEDRDHIVETLSKEFRVEINTIKEILHLD